MGILSERKWVNILGGTVLAFFLLLAAMITVQQMQEDASLKDQQAKTEWDVENHRIEDRIREKGAKIVELEIGPMAAGCFLAIGDTLEHAKVKWDPAEMVKHCGMTAEEAKRQSLRYPR